MLGTDVSLDALSVAATNARMLAARGALRARLLLYPRSYLLLRDLSLRLLIRAHTFALSALVDRSWRSFALGLRLSVRLRRNRCGLACGTLFRIILTLSFRLPYSITASRFRRWRFFSLLSRLYRRGRVRLCSRKLRRLTLVPELKLLLPLIFRHAEQKSPVSPRHRAVQPLPEFGVSREAGRVIFIGTVSLRRPL